MKTQPRSMILTTTAPHSPKPCGRVQQQKPQVNPMWQNHPQPALSTTVPLTTKVPMKAAFLNSPQSPQTRQGTTSGPQTASTPDKPPPPLIPPKPLDCKGTFLMMSCATIQWQAFNGAEQQNRPTSLTAQAESAMPLPHTSEGMFLQKEEDKNIHDSMRLTNDTICTTQWQQSYPMPLKFASMLSKGIQQPEY